MKLISKQLGNRMSEISINFEGTKSDETLKEKYNYCSQEFVVADTIIKNGYESYLSIGMEHNRHDDNGLCYNIETEYNFEDNKKHDYIVTYKVFEIRKSGVDIKLQKEYKYESSYKFRPTLDKFIKDLYKDGIIAEFYN